MRARTLDVARLFGLVALLVSTGCGATHPIARDGDGDLTPAQIMTVVRAHQGEVRACYESRVEAEPALAGRVTVAWRVGRDGAVVHAQIAGSTLSSPEVERCIVDVVQAWRFPEPAGGEVDVSFPFIFGQTAPGT